MSWALRVSHRATVGGLHRSLAGYSLRNHSHAYSRPASIAKLQLPRAHVFSLANASRNLSTSRPAQNTEATPSQSIPEPLINDPALSLSDISVPEVTSYPPLHYGDLTELNLTGWGPSGLFNWSLELINVSTGLPWVWTIVAASVFWRAVTVPFSLTSLRSSSRMPYIQKDLARIREKTDAAMASGDRMKMFQHQKEIQTLFKQNDIHPVKMMVYGPLIQLPIAFGGFFGLRKLCQLPLPQLTQTGLDLLPDLAAANTTVWLPIITLALFQTQMHLSFQDADASQRKGTLEHFPNILRVISIVSFPVLYYMHTGILVYFCTGAIFGIVQTLVLRIKKVRDWLGIWPRQPQPPQPTMLDTAKYFLGFLGGR